MISVIIPVYNSGSTIIKCLSSISTQTVSDYEVIIVDDGSTDESPKICDKFAKEADKFHVYHRPNEGVSAARNFAISKAKGQYVCFIDSDDWVDSNYLETLLSGMNENIDLVFSFARLNKKGVLRFPTKDSYIIERSNYSRFLYEDIIRHFTAPWAKLFKKEIIDNNSIVFPENLPLGEDAVFLLRYIPFCSAVQFITDCGYEYVITSENSLTKKLYSPERENNILNSIRTSITTFRNTIYGCPTNKPDALSKIEFDYARRVLDSIYFKSSFNRTERLVFIKSLPQDLLRNANMEGSIRAMVLSTFLRAHLFRLYDFTRTIAAYLR